MRGGRRSGSANLAVLVVGLVGCARADRAPPGYQGIVELEERVIAAEVSGKIERVAVKRGDVLEAGALMVQVEDTLERLARDAREDEAKVAQADVALVRAGSRPEDIAAVAAQVKGAKASEGLLGKVLERTRALAASGAVSAAELDRAVAEQDRATSERRALEQRLTLLQRGARKEEVDRVKAREEAAVSALELATARLAKHTVHAPGPGMILDVHALPGELAAPGRPLLTIADVAHPYVEVFVPEAEITSVRLGLGASVRVDGREGALSGAVEHIAQRAEFAPRFLFSDRERPNLVLRVRVRVDDPGHELRAGTPAFATFVR